MAMKKYTKIDMISFANYMRNGITNVEYCFKSEEGHLKDWQSKANCHRFFDSSKIGVTKD